MKLNDQACAVLMDGADGSPGERCFYPIGEHHYCPRHGDVRRVMEHYRETGELTEESKHQEQRQESILSLLGKKP